MVELSFVDELGYTSFKVSEKWLDKQTETDAAKIYNLACVDEESELIS